MPTGSDLGQTGSDLNQTGSDHVNSNLAETLNLALDLKQERSLG